MFPPPNSQAERRASLRDARISVWPVRWLKPTATVIGVAPRLAGINYRSGLAAEKFEAGAGAPG